MAEDAQETLVVYDFFSFSLKVYGLAGIKLFEWDGHDRMRATDLLRLVLVLLNLSVNSVSKLSYCYLAEFVDNDQATAWFIYLLFATNAFVKMLSVVLGRHDLYAVLRRLEKLMPPTLKEQRDCRLHSGHQTLMFHVRWVVYLHFSISFIFACFPFVQSVIQYYMQTAGERDFMGLTPYVLFYPFEITSGWTYVIAYVTQMAAGFTASCYFVGAEALLLTTTRFIILLYEYLELRIRSFKSQGYDKDLQELKELLHMHKELNEASKSVNGIFSLSILLNYMISIPVLVVLLINILIGSNLVDSVKFVLFLISFVLQIYYACWFAQDLMETSLGIGEAFLGQGWYMADVRYQRMLVLPIAISHRPSHLMAYKFFMISMESFGNLLSTSYRLFTLMSAYMTEEEM